ncbi:MAG: hypothetical protein R3B36_06115 [Polyangiaceae bacterium]
MVARARTLALVALFAAAPASCARPRTPHLEARWHYQVDAPGAGSRVVAVQAMFEDARTDRLTLPPDSMKVVSAMELWTAGGWRTVQRTRTGWSEPSCRSRCTVRYTIDLGELAAACGDEVDCASRVGAATLSPAMAWLAHPVPRLDVPATVDVRSPNALEFVSGMHAVGDTGRRFGFRSIDLDEGSFTAFGPLRRYVVDLPAIGRRPARIDLALVGSDPFAMSDEGVRAWVEEAGGVVAQLFGRFPVDRSTLFVLPAKGREGVVFGKVLALAGASAVIVLGDRTPSAARHDDWVLVHELFHLGFPTFRGEGRWLGEGLATYYEPVLRSRARWTAELDVFTEFARNMPRGLPPRGSAAGLAYRADSGAIYWGGALFALAADVKIRERTGGKRSLDDVMRAVLDRGGDATRVWTVAQVMKLGDEVTGTDVLTELYDRHAARGEAIDLDGLLGALGVEVRPPLPGGTEPEVELLDDRPLSAMRRAIALGAP